MRRRALAAARHARAPAMAPSRRATPSGGARAAPFHPPASLPCLNEFLRRRRLQLGLHLGHDGGLLVAGGHGERGGRGGARSPRVGVPANRPRAGGGAAHTAPSFPRPPRRPLTTMDGALAFLRVQRRKLARHAQVRTNAPGGRGRARQRAPRRGKRSLALLEPARAAARVPRPARGWASVRHAARAARGPRRARPCARPPGGCLDEPRPPRALHRSARHGRSRALRARPTPHPRAPLFVPPPSPRPSTLSSTTSP